MSAERVPHATEGEAVVAARERMTLAAIRLGEAWPAFWAAIEDYGKAQRDAAMCCCDRTTARLVVCPLHHTCPSECAETNHPGMEHHQWLAHKTGVEEAGR